MSWLSKIARAFRTAPRSVRRGLESMWNDFVLQSDTDTDHDLWAAVHDPYGSMPWVYACLWAIASFGAMVPLRVYRIVEGKVELVEQEHEAVRLLDQLNGDETPFTFWSEVLLALELYGNAYLLKHALGAQYSGKPEGLWLLDSRNVTEETKGGKVLRYRYYMDGQLYYISPDAVVPIRYPSASFTVRGQGSSRALRRTLEADYHAHRFNLSLLRNHARPYGVLKVKGFLTNEQRELLRKEWNIMHQGTLRAGKVGMIEGDVDWLAMGETPADMQFAELRKMLREEIIAAFGLYPTVLGLPAANYATAREQRRMFAENTMVPKLTLIEQAITKFFLADFGDNLIARFDYTNVPALKDDEAMKAQLAATLVSNRILSPNEARQLFYHLAPYEGGDMILAPLTLSPVGSVTSTVMQAVSTKPKQGAHRLTEPQRVERWHAYYKRVLSVEKKMLQCVHQMLDAQREAVLQALHERTERELPRPAQRLADEIIDVALLIDIGEGYLRTGLEAAMKEGMKHALEPLGDVGIDVTLLNEQLVKWVKTHALEHCQTITGTTVKQLKNAIVEVMSKGGSVKDIEAAINEVFDERFAYAHTIARTETLQAIQTAQFYTWDESEVVEAKEWLSSHSPNMRESHGAIDHEVVPLHEAFSIGVMYPGDPSGPPEETINCLCDMVPVVDTQAKAAKLVSHIAQQLEPVGSGGRGTQRWERKQKLEKLTQQANT